MTRQAGRFRDVLLDELDVRVSRVREPVHVDGCVCCDECRIPVNARRPLSK